MLNLLHNKTRYSLLWMTSGKLNPHPNKRTLDCLNDPRKYYMSHSNKKQKKITIMITYTGEQDPKLRTFSNNEGRFIVRNSYAMKGRSIRMLWTLFRYSHVVVSCDSYIATIWVTYIWKLLWKLVTQNYEHINSL